LNGGCLRFALVVWGGSLGLGVAFFGLGGLEGLVSLEGLGDCPRKWGFSQRRGDATFDNQSNMKFDRLS
jgi:hypothetical protein